MSIVRKTIVFSFFVLLGCAENQVVKPKYCMISKKILNQCVDAASNEEYVNNHLERIRMAYELALKTGFDLGKIESILNAKDKAGRCFEILSPYRKYDNRDSKCALITIYTGKPIKPHDNTVVAIDSGAGGFSEYTFGLDNGNSILISESTTVY